MGRKVNNSTLEQRGYYLTARFLVFSVGEMRFLNDMLSKIPLSICILYFYSHFSLSLDTDKTTNLTVFSLLSKTSDSPTLRKSLCLLFPVWVRTLDSVDQFLGAQGCQQRLNRRTWLHSMTSPSEDKLCDLNFLPYLVSVFSSIAIE